MTLPGRFKQREARPAVFARQNGALPERGLVLAQRRGGGYAASVWAGAVAVKTILDERGMAETLAGLADQIAASVPRDGRLAVVGIRNRGEVLGDRLIRLLEDRGFDPIDRGVLDITLYRDDLAEKGPDAVVRSTEIDFDLNDCTLVLVDDVLWTGRSARAALDALVDLGRPQAVRLAVLVDRPGRELPIQADFVGVRTQHADQHVNVMVAETDGQDRVEVG